MTLTSSLKQCALWIKTADGSMLLCKHRPYNTHNVPHAHDVVQGPCICSDKCSQMKT
jgi:hypothetical protein